VSSTESQGASAVELNTQTGSLLIKKNGGVLSLLDPPLLLCELMRSSVTLDTAEQIAVEGRSMKARCAGRRARCHAQPPSQTQRLLVLSTS
jgi:hypothetical protein